MAVSILRKFSDVFWAEKMDGWQGLEVRRTCVHDFRKFHALAIVNE